MSVRVKVSYTDEEELQDILRRLEPDVKHCKVAKRQEGTYRNAYIYMQTKRERVCRIQGGREPEKGRQGERYRSQRYYCNVRIVCSV